MTCRRCGRADMDMTVISTGTTTATAWVEGAKWGDEIAA
jgi:hypothetical protein